MQGIFRALLLTALLAAGGASAGDITLDQAVLATSAKGKVTFRNVTLVDCNLSQTEAMSLFSGALPREEAGALLERMTAKEVRIPEAEIVAENGDRFTLHDVVAQTIASGGAEKLTLASLDGVLPDDSGDATVHSQALRLDKLSLPGLAAAMRGGDAGLAALRFSHMEWEGGELSTVDKGTPAGIEGGNRIVVRAGAARLDQTLDADGAPVMAQGDLDGLSLKMPPKSKGGSTLSAFGYNEVVGAAHFAGGYDAAAKIYRLADYSFDFQKIGKIAFSGAFSGVEKAAFLGDKAARQAALGGATIDWAQISLTNAGLFDKLVAFSALSQGRTPDDVKAQWRAIVAQGPLLLSGAPAVEAAAKAVDRFIADPKTLTLRVKGKDSPLKVDELVHAADPMALLGRLDVDGAPDAAKKP